MVRKYKRKTEEKAYTSDHILRALRAIANRTPIRVAAREYGIPEATLRKQWNKNKPKSDVDSRSSSSTATTTSTVAPTTTRYVEEPSSGEE